ncbi:hypothetical protein KGF56_002720 [Candida oxycetoniae]|uniref:MINDY deubiquitinase domain-containing protein n=1 Tax=Candida oxycetoniae TaxID=497107 RepID=A0AAI9WXR8_9ASCO|nr:uncharacterized protein KGF56_002720 [Candida oxycetoniae]KAI3404528.2 hypothetical protein KGF56_002720 [Candida oxycetoniae]
MLKEETSSRLQNTVSFPIKVLNWSPHINTDSSISTPILLQDKNGPCPLIALVNTLLLKDDFQRVDVGNDSVREVPQDMTSLSNLKHELLKSYHKTGLIELNEVLSLVGNLLLTFAETSQNLKPEVVDKLLMQLPQLHTGLDVNPNLLDGSFSSNLATQLFEVFGLNFRHGWVFDQPQPPRIVSDEDEDLVTHLNNTTIIEKVSDQRRLTNIIQHLKTFDDIQDYLLAQEASTLEVVQNQNLLETWLDQNCTQLTLSGLAKLDRDLEKDEFIIFFRNNHLNTLFKKGSNELYLLVTDASFQNKSLSSQIVWQSLASVSGNEDLFFTGNFTPVLDIDQDLSYAANTGYDNTFDSDLLLSKQLQEEEDAAIAKRLQEKYSNREKKLQNINNPTHTKVSSNFRLKQKAKSKEKHTNAAAAATAADAHAVVVDTANPMPLSKTSPPIVVQTKVKNPEKVAGKKKKLFGLFSK